MLTRVSKNAAVNAPYKIDIFDADDRNFNFVLFWKSFERFKSTVMTT